MARNARAEYLVTRFGEYEGPDDWETASAKLVKMGARAARDPKADAQMWSARALGALGKLDVVVELANRKQTRDAASQGSSPPDRRAIRTSGGSSIGRVLVGTTRSRGWSPGSSILGARATISYGRSSI